MHGWAGRRKARGGWIRPPVAPAFDSRIRRTCAGAQTVCPISVESLCIALDRDEKGLRTGAKLAATDRFRALRSNHSPMRPVARLPVTAVPLSSGETIDTTSPCGVRRQFASAPLWDRDLYRRSAAGYRRQRRDL
jgi:hypothetical protein